MEGRLGNIHKAAKEWKTMQIKQKKGKGKTEGKKGEHQRKSQV
jgi:hypothetical protein